MKIEERIEPRDLERKINKLWEVSALKIERIEREYDHSRGSPVFTVRGKYTSRGWTEWTQGFEFGSALLQFDATGEEKFLELGRSKTLDYMAPHITHMGVHDHGFNNISTYGNLLRLMREGKIPFDPWERRFYELALKCSGACQAYRWSRIYGGGGYIYSFNGPHSLFADTIRSLRSLAVAHLLGGVLVQENDERINLLERLIEHARTTATYSVFYGEGRDAYDVRGRVAHEIIFNPNDGRYRCPNSQQGASPFTTWTRGLAWIMCGFAEELEFLDCLPERELQPFGGRKEIEAFMLRAALATCDFYIESTPLDGIPYWDTGAPGLHLLGDYLSKPADPFNDFEPVDSSAAAIAAQGLLRLGHYLQKRAQKEGDSEKEESGKRYFKAGLTILDRLFDDPYLSLDPEHHGLILHSVYHRPAGWDYVPPGRKVPCGEASMWGDYHAREAALYVQRLIKNEPYLLFFSGGLWQ